MNYLLTFDQTITDSQTQASLHKALTNMQGASDWWHYLPNVYILVSTNTSGAISDYIYKLFPTLRFLVVKISLEDSNGVLQKDAWEWINKHKQLPSPLRTILKASASQSRLPPIPSLLPYLGPTPATSSSLTMQEMLKRLGKK